jgi:hypothetical protein
MLYVHECWAHLWAQYGPTFGPNRGPFDFLFDAKLAPQKYRLIWTVILETLHNTFLIVTW